MCKNILKGSYQCAFMTCLRCDGTGKYRNEFGLMEKCESCQGADMTFEKVSADPDSDEE